MDVRVDAPGADQAGAETPVSDAGTSDTPTTNGDGGRDVGREDAAVDVEAGCPSAAPAAGDPCLGDGIVCTYGEEAFPLCRAAFVCSQSTFVQLPKRCVSATCGDAIEDTDICDAQDLPCVAGDGSFCGCDTCRTVPGLPCDAGILRWQCTPPPAPPCPATAPNAGTACAAAAAACYYGQSLRLGLQNGVCAVCEAGTWGWYPPQNGPEPCAGRSCTASCIVGRCSSGSGEVGVCSLGTTCCGPRPCTTSADCQSNECCTDGVCGNHCPGACAADTPARTAQFCVDAAATCTRQGSLASVVLVCPSGACCTDPDRAVCCRVPDDILARPTAAPAPNEADNR